MKIESFYDERTSTLTYVVYDPTSRDTLVIDPVLDYEPASSKTWTESVDTVIAFINTHQLNVHYILETHAHADHLSGAQYLKRAFPDAKNAIGARIREVQQLFASIFNLPQDFPTDGRQFDKLLVDNEIIRAGELECRVIYTPGHTPACVSYIIEDAVFTGDTLFMPDQGTGRCDFPGGSSSQMYHSITKRLYTLPDATRVFVGHDYQPGGRDLKYESTIGEEKRSNHQLGATTIESDYIDLRNARDKTLDAPRLLFQSVQVNIDAGHLPQPSENQVRYLRIPINVFRPPSDDSNVELGAI